MPLTGQSDFHLKLASAAVELTAHQVEYDPSYFSIAYPNGDVPSNKGVCTDVIIRAYRKVGRDLQQEVHEDMKANFAQYPKNWGLRKTDTNIDHRRVPNLAAFFKRSKAALPVTGRPEDYRAGDLVTWMLPGQLPHIGIVSTRAAHGRPLVIHNIGAGTREEDALFAYRLTGHYRYPPARP